MSVAGKRVRVVVVAVVAMAAVLLGVGEASAARTTVVPTSRTKVVPSSVTLSSDLMVTRPKVDGLRLRAAGSFTGRVKGLLYKSDRFQVTGWHGDWVQVRLTKRSATGMKEDTTGWAYRSYVRKPKNCPSTWYICQHW